MLFDFWEITCTFRFWFIPNLSIFSVSSLKRLSLLFLEKLANSSSEIVGGLKGDFVMLISFLYVDEDAIFVPLGLGVSKEHSILSNCYDIVCKIWFEKLFDFEHFVYHIL